MFLDDLAKSVEITKRKFFRRPFFERLKESIAGVLKRQL